MRLWLAAGAVSAFLAVAIGALAAHGLEARLSSEALGWIDTGARYGLAHGVALMALAGLSCRLEVFSRLAGHCFRVAGAGFSIGCLAFSVTLYVMALSGGRELAFIVPFGGVAFLLGWGALLVAAVASGPRR